MRRAFAVVSLFLVSSLVAAALQSPTASREPATKEQITINTNRAAAGVLADKTLTVRLDARTGEWHPDGDSDPGVLVGAFAVEGGPLQVPAPLIRVTEGTELQLIVRNSLDKPLIVHGLYSRVRDRSALPEAVTIAVGDSREIRFSAAIPGTYYYWASTRPDSKIGDRLGRDSQLSGAFIVEPRGVTPKEERVFVIGLWTDSVVVGDQNVPVGRIVINGKSWPNTERLIYRVGDSVHMRVINAGAAVHPMHLHGFYYNVDSRGDERIDTIFPPGSSAHLVNTERLPSGSTFSLTWVPTRAGNWLFHCHDNLHIIRNAPLDGRPLPAEHHDDHDMAMMMGGPVIGITVLPAGNAPVVGEPAKRRHLRLVARVDTGGTDAEPAYGFTLDDGKRSVLPSHPYLPGPTIVLKRGEPVSITVLNELPEPTAVHWHGIELESFYDGVPGFAGAGSHLAPAIAPGKTFEARFTPPRSGTFIYHVHYDEVRQQQAGLSGALLVVDSPESYDPQHDFVFLVTAPRRSEDDKNNIVFLNGSPTPPPREMHVGEHYRLRFINIHTSRPSMRMHLLRDSSLLAWRAIAKDGMDLPSDQATTSPSVVQMSNGETYDFDFVPSAAGDIRVDVKSAAGDLLASMPLHIP